MTKGRKPKKTRPGAAQQGSPEPRPDLPAPSAEPSGTAGTGSLPAWLLALGIALLAFFAYAPVVDNGFIWDDDDYIELNPLLRDDGGLVEIWNPSSAKNPQYYPFVFTTFWVEYRLWGLDPTGYHVVNLLLHATGAVLLFLLLRRVGVPGAWLVAAAFAAHPAIVESVAWAAERKNVLSGVFYFLAAHAYLSFDRSRKKGWYAAALACFFLALTAKTVTASLPIALGLVLWWKRGRIEPRQVATLVPMVALGFVMGMLTRRHEYAHVLSDSTVLEELTALDRVLIAGRALWFYPAKIFWPRDYAFIYERWAIAPGSLAQWLFPLAAVVFVAGLFVLHRRGLVPRGPVAAVLFYGATIFPALGFVNVAPMRFSYVADHFQYLASIGSFLIGTAMLVTLLARFGASRAFPAAAVVIAVGLTLLARQQVRHYRDLGTLWGHTAQLSPNNPMVLNSYANWLRKQDDPELRARAEEYNRRAIELGDRENQLLGQTNVAVLMLAEERYADALAEADRALALNPGFPLTLKVRGEALYRLGRYAEAEEALRAVLGNVADASDGRHAWDLRRRVDDAGVHLMLGLAQREQRKDAETVASFERAIEANPDLHEAYVLLGNWHGLNDRLEQAAECYRRLIRRDPPPEKAAQAYLQLGRTCVFLERPDEAIEAFAAAARIAPADAQVHRFLVERLLAERRYPAAVEALRAAVANVAQPIDFQHRLAWVLATAPDPAARDGAGALAVARGLASGSPPARTLSVLAAAEAEAGDFGAALGTLARAREALGRGGADPALESQLAQQQESYERGRPTRLP